MEGLKDRVKKYRDLKDERKLLEDRVKEIIKECAELVEQIIPLMVNEDMQNATYPGIGRVSLVLKKFPKIEDQDKFYAYLNASGQESLIKTSVNAISLKSWYKEVNLKISPEEIGLAVYEELSISLTKG